MISNLATKIDQHFQNIWENKTLLLLILKPARLKQNIYIIYVDSNQLVQQNIKVERITHFSDLVAFITKIIEKKNVNHFKPKEDANGRR